VVLDGIEVFRKCPRAIIKYHVCRGVLIKSVIWKNTTGVPRHELGVDPTGKVLNGSSWVLETNQSGKS
jgi:hypothetical protein